MNKYLMMSAAAVLATTAGANAGTYQHSFTFGTSGGGSYCDGGNLYTSGASVWSWQHVNSNACSGVSYGQGLTGKLSALGYKAGDMSDTDFGQNYGIFSEYVNFTLPGKIKNGKPYTIWVGFSGTTSFLVNAGPLKNVSAASGIKSKGARTALSSLKQMIAVHRANKN